MDQAEESGFLPVVNNVSDLSISTALARILSRSSRIKQHSKLWYTTRTRMLTASDVASVIGANPYTPRKSVFLRKTGQSKPFSGNKATRRGHELEPIARAEYEKATGKKCWPEDLGLMVHPEYATIGASPDGVTLDGTLVEIKCPLYRKIEKGVVPAYYLPQVQTLLEVFDLETCHFVQYRPSDGKVPMQLDITTINRDRQWFAKHLPAMLDFMTEVFAFYENRNLPIGVPRIDWEQEDPAVAAIRASGEPAKICAFVDDKFVVEAYNGVDQPVVRTEYTLSDDPVDKKVEALLADTGEDNTFQSILDALPAHLRPDPADFAADSEDDEDKEENEGFLDFEAINAEMTKRRRLQSLHPPSLPPQPLPLSRS